MNFKKLIFIFCIVMFTMPAIADSENKLPVWEDYCPKKYLNVKTVTSAEYMQLQKIKFIPPTQRRLDNYNLAVEYWNDRKLKFEKFLEVCSNFPEEKQEGCFKRLDEREIRLNKELQDLKEKQLQSGEKTTTPASVYLDTTNPLKNMMYRGY